MLSITSEKEVARSQRVISVSSCAAPAGLRGGMRDAETPARPGQKARVDQRPHPPERPDLTCMQCWAVTKKVTNITVILLLSPQK